MAVTFDSKISLGNILTIASMIAGLFGAYSMLDKRVTVLEQQRTADAQQAQATTSAVTKALDEVKADVKDISRALQQIAWRQSPQQAGR